MPIKSTRAAAALGGALLLSACNADGEHPAIGWPDRMGEATRQTLAAQIIDPDPVYDTAVGASSGEHAAQAVTRYRTDKVKKPERLQTSTLSGTGASTGGSQ
ncbi:MAG TPA: hypothetical protein VF440_00955 [Novosphingobium sp.]